MSYYTYHGRTVMNGRKPVAWTVDEPTAERIADALNDHDRAARPAEPGPADSAR